MFGLFQKKEVAPVVKQEIKLHTRNQQQFEDKIVLEHIVGYIQKLSEESQSGFNYCAKEVSAIAQSLPKGSEQRESLEYVGKMLVHLSERMEYIDAHKIKPWDEMAYRKFIMQYCPVKNNDEDDE